jgi:hypothetical protein
MDLFSTDRGGNETLGDGEETTERYGASCAETGPDLCRDSSISCVDVGKYLV